MTLILWTAAAGALIIGGILIAASGAPLIGWSVTALGLTGDAAAMVRWWKS